MLAYDYAYSTSHPSQPYLKPEWDDATQPTRCRVLAFPPPKACSSQLEPFNYDGRVSTRVRPRYSQRETMGGNASSKVRCPAWLETIASINDRPACTIDERHGRRVSTRCIHETHFATSSNSLPHNPGFGCLMKSDPACTRSGSGFIRQVPYFSLRARSHTVQK